MGQLRPEKLAPGRAVLLDTVAFIYFLEHHPKHYQTAKALFRRIESGELSAMMSTLVFAELLVPAYRKKETARAASITGILSNYPNLTICPVTTRISAKAARLRADYNLRTPDAIHLATALAEKADALVTNGRDFSKLAIIEILLFDAG